MRCLMPIIIRLLYFINKVRDKLVTLKFKFVTNTRNQVSIHYPAYTYGEKYIKIIGRMSSCPGLRIECIDKWENQEFHPQLIIGNNVSFNFRCHVGCINKIVIGNNVLIGSNVLITDHSHGDMSSIELGKTPIKRNLYSKGPVIIGNNVWIGENVVILPNVHIGDNCIIGASSVLTKSVPPNSIICGNPAQVVKNLG